MFGGGVLSSDQATQLQDAVDQEMARRKNRLLERRIPELQKEIELAVLPVSLFEWLSGGFKVRRRTASVMLSGGLSLD